MTVKLSSEQLTGLKSMNLYWQEIKNRDEVSKYTIGLEEIQNLIVKWDILRPIDILLIIGQYVENYGKDSQNA